MGLLATDASGADQNQPTGDLAAAVQSLLDQVRPGVAFNYGDYTMFFLDTPPDVPPQYVPLVIAQASQARKGDTNPDRTIGVCQLIHNPPVLPGDAYNGFGVLGGAASYFELIEKRNIDNKEVLAGTVTLLSGPTHGTLELFPGTKGAYQYVPTDPTYVGQDRATFLVQIAGYKVKVIYFFNVLHEAPSESDQGSPYDDKQYCPSGPVWKISLNESDPSDLITFQSPLPWTSYPPLSTTVTFSIADLPGQTLGDAVAE